MKTFGEVSKASWKQKILEDLQGKDFEQLVWQTDEGFAVQPFYTEEDLEKVAYLLCYQNAVAGHRNEGGVRDWENREIIWVKEEKQANKEALLALEHGADGICFDVSRKNTLDFNLLFKGIYLNYCTVSFKANPACPVQLARDYLAYAGGQNIAANELSGSINYDPLAIWSMQGLLSHTAFYDLAQMVNLYREAPDFGVLTINSSPFHNAGSHAVQELAFTLSAAVETLQELTGHGLAPEDIIGSLSFSISTGSDFFTEIAKLRALRILFYQVAGAYGIENYHPGDIPVHSISALYNKTAIDPHVNMLRNTTEAMSAVLGGCNALSILPHDASFQEPSAFSKRIVRNVSAILREESYFNKVADPAAGSYYLENLTGQLAEHSWKLFQEIEHEGGYREAFGKGIIQRKIKKTQQALRQKTAERKAVLVGVNQYANPHMPAATSFKEQPPANNRAMELLVPMYQSADFDKIRLKTDQYLKKGGEQKNIGVHIALLSTSHQARARAEFAGDFMATGGFLPETAPFVDLERSQKNALGTSAPTIILCGTDDDYIQYAEEFTGKLKAKGKILLMAAPPEKVPHSITTDIEPVYQGASAIEIITGIQEKLNITS